MKYIAIIAAEDKEVEAVSNLMKDIYREKLYNIDICVGKIKEIPCLLAKAGIGKVNAARTTQVIIDKFDVVTVVNVGAAGAAEESLNIGDIVISTGLIQYDFDVTAFGREKGFISGVGKIFEADERLVKLCEDAANTSDFRYKKGLIATGDRFVNSSEEKLAIKNEFGAKCIEMEGAAIAHVCKLCEIPFVVIRSISDEVNGEAIVDFEEFLETASKKCAELIELVVDKTKDMFSF